MIMWKDELKEFFKFLGDNMMLNGVYGSEAIVDSFFNQKQSLKTELLKKLSVLPYALKKQAYERYDKTK